MQQRTFKAKNVTDALALVKRDLGGDAMIISTRSVKARSVLGLPGRSAVEIVAAVPDPTPRAEPRSASQAAWASRRQRAAVAAGEDPLAAPPPEFVQRATAVADRPRATRPAAQPERANISSLIAAVAGRSPMDEPPAPTGPKQAEPRNPSPTPQAQPPAPTPAASPAASPAPAALEAEIAVLKSLVGQVLQTAQRTAVAVGRTTNDPSVATSTIPPADPLFASYGVLLDAHVPADIADQLLAAVRTELSAHELQDADIIRQTLLHVLARRLPTIPHEHSKAQHAARRIAIFGPTGVGKTTTIAKLAATHRLRYGREVALITTDTYRIAAVEQLRTYAGLIGVPIKVARDAAEVAAACKDFASAQTVLIDTAGRSHRDTPRLTELAALTDAADPHERHLALAASTPTHALPVIAKRFTAARPDRVIATKLDEAIGLGALLAIQQATGLPFSHITTGQEVPDDIQAADADRLARLVLAGALSEAAAT